MSSSSSPSPFAPVPVTSSSSSRPHPPLPSFPLLLLGRRRGGRRAGGEALSFLVHINFVTLVSFNSHYLCSMSLSFHSLISTQSAGRTASSLVSTATSPVVPRRIPPRVNGHVLGRANRDGADGGRGGRGAPQERGRRRGRGDASRADQWRSWTGNRRMTRAPWPALSVAASRSGRGRTTMTLVMAAEAGARRRDVERDGRLYHGHCWSGGQFKSNVQYSSI